ncbi:MAG: livF [Clostridia bacterium]|jgi:branched-chain amino acid transport system ATP-binding protein|nr:livF [Clostridia bacterium]
MLKVDNIEVYYGAIHAIKGVSFEVEKGQIVTLIGANGAGKTTIMHTVSGLIKPQTGTISFSGSDITHTRAHTIVEMGMAHVPEGRRVFAKMTVKENLEMGAYTRKNKADLDADFDMVYGRFPRLKERRKQLAGTMSGGEQQMLAIARALMSKPTLMLLDEPSMGLAPILVDEVFSIIKDINKSGTTILLVEQNAHKALNIADKAYVLETGKIVLSGDAKEMLNDEAVKKAYLG